MKNKPDRTVYCDTAAITVDPVSKLVGVTFVDLDGLQVFVAMHGVLLRGLAQDVDNVLETSPEILYWDSIAAKG